jgi:hypothetical protein
MERKKKMKMEHSPELDLHVVVLLLHPVDLCTDALIQFQGFPNSEYFLFDYWC